MKTKLLTFLFGVMLSFNVHAETTDDFLAHWTIYAAYAHTLVHKDAEGAFQLWVSDAASRTTKNYLKERISKERPSGANDNSFPSGHTTSAAAPAYYIVQRYGWKEGWPYVVAATIVAQRRVARDAHYWEDVAASHLIAYGWSKVFVSPEDSDGGPVIGITYDDGLRFHFFKTF